MKRCKGGAWIVIRVEALRKRAGGVRLAGCDRFAGRSGWERLAGEVAGPYKIRP